MKKFHIAIAVEDIKKSIADYSEKLSAEPEIIILDEYALWRTATLNFSIRKTADVPIGTVRHIGWEDAKETEFKKNKDVNGLLWESFNAEGQRAEIREAWPDAEF
jgi:hypothetical protein